MSECLSSEQEMRLYHLMTNLICSKNLAILHTKYVVETRRGDETLFFLWIAQYYHDMSKWRFGHDHQWFVFLDTYPDRLVGEQ